MGRDSSPNAAERPQHGVTLQDFKLDRYEVTVGRFRNFVEMYDSWLPPAEGSGAYAGKPASGWESAWDTILTPDAASLSDTVSCGLGTWSGGAEALAISCLDWYTAFAFCIWDGGRLPTEAEWEYAAAGGSEERVYSWGDTWSDPLIANYNNYGQVIAVGTAGSGLGRGRFGQYDLTGNVWEWVRDDFDPAFYATPAATERNPLNVHAGATSALRGASFFHTLPETTTAFGREARARVTIDPTIGMRCARD